MNINYIDPACVPDIFIDRVAAIEPLGNGNFRFVCTVVSHGDNLCVARLVMHQNSAMENIRRSATGIGARVPLLMRV